MAHSLCNRWAVKGSMRFVRSFRSLPFDMVSMLQLYRSVRPIAQAFAPRWTTKYCNDFGMLVLAFMELANRIIDYNVNRITAKQRYIAFYLGEKWKCISNVWLCSILFMLQLSCNFDEPARRLPFLAICPFWYVQARAERRNNFVSFNASRLSKRDLLIITTIDYSCKLCVAEVSEISSKCLPFQ